MLIDQVNEDNLILERNGLLKKDAESELETAFKESTSDLPLGKALNLLLNIHSRVFDKAVTTIRESTPTELTVQSIESPSIRALISIENYLSSSDNFSKSFDHVYRSLEDKFIKRNKANTNESSMRIIGYIVLYSKHQKLAQQYISQELYAAEKRSQLAAVILLQFLFTNYISTENMYVDMSASFIPPLTQISQKYGDSPTLLACSSCDLALQFSRYIALHMNNITDTAAPITELQDDNNLKFPKIVKAWEYADNLLSIMKKWHKSMGELELAAFAELHLFLGYAMKFVEDNSQAMDLLNAWDVIVTYLTPKAIVSEKTLTIKKQKLLFSCQTTPLMSTIKIIIFIILQKGRLIELYGDNRSSPIYSDEEEEVKQLFKKEYDIMIKSYPVKNLGDQLIPLLVTKLPFLCTTENITSNELIQLIIDHVEYNKKTSLWLVPLLTRNPEVSVCSLLLHVLEQKDRSQSSYDLLGELISQNSSAVVTILENNLLPVLKSSNQACELLIQCMEYTNLPSLVRKLMSMVDVEDQREKMTYIALISKALLHHTWANYSILIYIDLVRDFKLHKRFETPIKPDFTALPKFSPNDIVNYKNFKPLNKKYNDEELKNICLVLMGPIQLWSTKADDNTLKTALNQLVYKTNSLPGEAICIDSWRHLSYAFLSNHELIWSAIRPCVDVMKSFTTSQKLDEHTILKQITPMLILQTIPKESFDIVKLPKSYVNLLSDKIKSIAIDPQDIKLCDVQNEYTTLCIELMDVLLSRCLENSYIGDIKNPIEFYIALLTKIFCK